MKTGEKVKLLVDGGRELFARKLPNDASGYDIGTDPSIYTIPMTASIHETSLRTQARRDMHGVPVEAGGKYYRFQLFIPDSLEPLWLTKSASGNSVAAFHKLDTLQSWKMVLIDGSTSRDVEKRELSPENRFLLIDDTGSSYVYLKAKGVLATHEKPLEHPRWVSGFTFQIQPLERASATVWKRTTTTPSTTSALPRTETLLESATSTNQTSFNSLLVVALLAVLILGLALYMLRTR